MDLARFFCFFRHVSLHVPYSDPINPLRNAFSAAKIKIGAHRSCRIRRRPDPLHNGNETLCIQIDTTTKKSIPTTTKNLYQVLQTTKKSIHRIQTTKKIHRIYKCSTRCEHGAAGGPPSQLEEPRSATPPPVPDEIARILRASPLKLGRRASPQGRARARSTPA